MEGSDGREVQNTSAYACAGRLPSASGLTSAAITDRRTTQRVRRLRRCVCENRRLFGAVLGVDGSDDVPNVVL